MKPRRTIHSGGSAGQGWRRAAAILVLAFLAALGAADALAAGHDGRVRIGVLTPGLTFNPVFAGLQTGLERLGYRADKNVTFIVEDTRGDQSDLGTRVRRLLQPRPHVIFTVTTAHTLAVKSLRTNVPVVFAWVSDPVGSAVVESYSSSKNNFTGVTSYSIPLAPKRLEILKEIAPGTERVLAIVSPAEKVARASYDAIEKTAGRLGMRLLRREASSRQEIARALEQRPGGSFDAVYHVPSMAVDIHFDLVLKSAREQKVPLMTHETLMVEQGALAGFGADFRQVGSQAARLVAKTLAGERPSDIPTETPEQLLLALNITTAKIVGLKIPLRFLEKVDRLLE